MKLKTVINQSLGKLPAINWEENLHNFIKKLFVSCFYINFTKQAFNDPLSLDSEQRERILRSGKTYFSIKNY